MLVVKLESQHNPVLELSEYETLLHEILSVKALVRQSDFIISVFWPLPIKFNGVCGQPNIHQIDTLQRG